MGKFSFLSHSSSRCTPYCPPSALPTVYSCVSAMALAVLTFAAMQVFRDELSAEGGMTILGGFIGSWFFIFVLTVRLGYWMKSLRTKGTSVSKLC